MVGDIGSSAAVNYDAVWSMQSISRWRRVSHLLCQVNRTNSIGRRDWVGGERERDSGGSLD